MKQRILLILLLLELWALKLKSQTQHGETCLFTCMQHICPDKFVPEYESDFNSLFYTNQDFYEYGAMGTWKQMIEFVHAEFETSQYPMLNAIDNGYRCMTTLWVDDEEDADYTHEIVIEAWYGQRNNPAKITLVYYDPSFGGHSTMNMLNFINSQPKYIIPCK